MAPDSNVLTLPSSSSSLTPFIVEHSGIKWSMYRGPNGEPLVSDLDLAEWLGYERPRDIRKLIERYSSALGPVCEVWRKPGPEGGRPGRDFFLNEFQSLLISGRSDTPKGTSTLGAMVQVFMMVRSGQSGAAVHLAPVRPVDNALARQGGWRQVLEGLLDLDTKLTGQGATIEALQEETQVLRGDSSYLRDRTQEIEQKLAAVQEFAELTEQRVTEKLQAIPVSSSSDQPLSDFDATVLRMFAAGGDGARQRRIAKQLGVPANQVVRASDRLYALGRLERTGPRAAPVYRVIGEVPAAAPNAIALIDAACRCRVKDETGRDLLRFIADKGPRVTYRSMSLSVGTHIPAIAEYLGAFYRSGVVQKERTKGPACSYYVIESGLSGHSEACPYSAPPAPPPTPPIPVPTPAPAPLPCVSDSIQQTLPIDAAPKKKEKLSTAQSYERILFVNHLRTYGKLNGLDYENLFNSVYAIMGAEGKDPRGKRDPVTGKKVSGVDYLDKMGWGPDAYRIALSLYPLPAVPRPSDNLYTGAHA